MSKIQDLEALGRMLDEGKIDREEYDRLKADLLAEQGPATVHPMAGKQAGWYRDPAGEANHQAYWDGEKWTGATRSSTEPSRTDSKKGLPGWVWVVGGGMILLAMGLSNLSQNDGRATFVTTSAPSGGNDRITLEGQGDGDTRTFRLSGGSYDIRTEVGNDCYYSFTLRDPSDGSRVDSITTMSEPGSTTVSLHGVDPGSYYVDVTTGPAPDCPWSQRWTSS